MIVDWLDLGFVAALGVIFGCSDIRSGWNGTPVSLRFARCVSARSPTTRRRARHGDSRSGQSGGLSSLTPTMRALVS
jgi:hypothetical protein